MDELALHSMLKLMRAKPREAKEIARLLSDVSDEKPVKNVKSLIKEKRVLVLKKNKKIRGAVSFTVFGFVGFVTFLWIDKLAIDPQFRGQGTGTVLLSLLKRYAASLGAVGFALFSLEKAKRFYVKSSLSNVWRFFWWMG
ncbi:MAG: GNAT superfamily N-acetyltransferase [Oceanicoccus sp.]|jgi:GNAT superfamily N-acetyltransferase